MSDVEILSIGDELLRGIVQETNSHWIATRVAARGATLRRTMLLPDEPEIVADEMRRALARRPALIVTHGGLGPTDDDRTREAIALATGRPCERNADAEAIVRRRYHELHAAGAITGADANDAALTMADLPRGARPIDNHIGTAPGVVLVHDDSVIVALPGVPPELQWMWDEPLAPMLDDLLGPGGFDERTVEIEYRDESRIAELLARVQAAHPAVYVKSRARGFGHEDLLRITVAANAASDAAARDLVTRAFVDVRARLDAEGISIRD